MKPRIAAAAVVAATVVGAALAAGPANAAQAPAGRGLPNVDRRADERAPVPAPTRAARRELRRDLGALGAVRPDAKSGGVAYVGRADGLLTGPSSASPRSVVLGYVRDHRAAFGLAERDIDAMRLVARSVSPDGIVHLRFNQVLDGVLAYDSGIDGHVTADGRLVTVSGAPVPGARLEEDAPALGAAAGLREARAAVGGPAAVPAVRTRAGGPGRMTAFAGGERAVLRWSATADGPRLAWSVIADDGDGRAYDVLVAADDGELLRRQDLTSHLGQASYFRADPLQTPAPATITMPPAWYDDHDGGTRLWGQYARTYVDPLDEDPEPGQELGGSRVQVPASGGAPAAPDWLYTQTLFPGASPCPSSGCTWDATDSGSRLVNQHQAATNVHVLASRFHDHLEQPPIGFDEASGNFQRVNASGAGLGGDYVRAEVNDGQGYNNANFWTPPDGMAPRMQMYLFSNAYTVNGGDVADIVYHEYTHGLSSRLVVNASGVVALSTTQARMMGEGWSDFYALDLLVHEGDVADTAASGELTVGSYVAGPYGIRTKPMDCPVDASGAEPRCNTYVGAGPNDGGYTYGDLPGLDNGYPHRGGEVWSQTLWDLREAVGRDVALALVTGGMRLSADDPSMLAMRDAIVQQALATRSYPGAADDYYAAVWRVFARRGMGGGASTPGPYTSETTESFALPSGLRADGGPRIADPYPGGDNDGEVEPGEVFTVTQAVTGPGLADLPGVTGALTSADADIDVLDGGAAWPLLGLGRSGVNGDPLVARYTAATCAAPAVATLTLSSAEGPLAVPVRIDPRPGSSAVVPLADANAGVPGVTTTSFEARGSGALTDVDLAIGELRHSWLGDLRVELIHAGVEATIFERLDEGSGTGSFSGQDVIDAVFDSDAAAAIPTTGAGPLTGRMQPQAGAALDAFDGTPAAGTWTLRITDYGRFDTGELRRWGIAAPEQPCTPVEIPAAQTSAAASVASAAATLSGSVTPNGRATGLRFAWGTTADYGETTPVEQVGDGAQPVLRTAALDGLAPSTTYHYRVEAIREGGQVAVVGEDRTLTTLPPQDGDGAGGRPLPPTPRAPPEAAPPAAASDTTPPRASRARVRLSRAARHTGRRRAALSLRVSEPATVRAVVTKAVRGVRTGRRCVALRRARGGRRSAARRCVRHVRVARVHARARRAGRVKLRLRRPLAAGRYRLRLRTIDTAGNRARTLTARFRVRAAARGRAPSTTRVRLRARRAR